MKSFTAKFEVTVTVGLDPLNEGSGVMQAYLLDKSEGKEEARKIFKIGISDSLMPNDDEVAQFASELGVGILERSFTNPKYRPVIITGKKILKRTTPHNPDQPAG